MPLSTRYKQLAARVAQLDGALPATTPSGGYTDAEHDLVRAYRLLTHAEIEAYLEDLATATAAAATAGWAADGRPRHTAVFLMLFDEHRDMATAWPSTAPIDRRKKILDRYLKQVRNNNGVKAANVLRLLLPLGLLESDLSPTWLAMMSSYGQERGEVAHSAKAVQTPPDPVVERTRVHQILVELAVVDRKVVRLQSKRFPAGLFTRLSAVSDGLSVVRRR